MSRWPASLAVGLLLPATATSQEVPARPELLAFEPIRFEVPRAREHRSLLKSGAVVYLREDHTLPLVNVSVQIRTGRYLEPAGHEGLAALVGSQMRRGGAGELTAEALDEGLDFLAAQVSTAIGDTAGSAGLNCLADNVDEALALFVAVLRSPRFQEDRLALAKQQALQALKKRNDDSAEVEAREWNILLLGEHHFTNRFPTDDSLRAITREELVAFHRRFFVPANMILAASGAFERGAMLRRLERALSRWPVRGEVVPLVPPRIEPAPPGLYRVQKDVNQGRVSIGLPGVMRDSPDIYALDVMNEILGGAGFSSRITARVRSNEGLAYSAGSGISFGVYYPGRFRASFQSKSRSVTFAAQLVMDEIRQMREALVSVEELETVKKNLIESFPSSFASAAQIVGTFASDEYTRRDPSFWTGYRDKIRSVAREDVRRAARRYLVPERMVVLIVGDQKEIDLAEPTRPVSPLSLAPAGRMVTLPARDPLTMRPEAR